MERFPSQRDLSNKFLSERQKKTGKEKNNVNCTEVYKLQQDVTDARKRLDNCLKKGGDCSEFEQEVSDAEDKLRPHEPKLVICDLLIGTWAFNGNGYTGTLTIEASDVQDNGSASFSGHAVIDIPHRDTLDGSYDVNTGVLRFTRTGDDNNARFQPQQYYGHIFANPRGNAKTTFGGVFAEGAPPLNSSSPWGWFMVRQ